MPGSGAAPSRADLKPAAGAGWLSPQDAIPRSVYLSASTLTVGALLGAWAFVAYGGFVNKDFLPTPTQVARAAVQLTADGTI